MKNLLTLVFLLLPFAAFGQKVLKPVNAALKSKDGAKALTLIAKLETDSVAKRLPRLYDMGKEANVIINDAENEKAYLKQAYDTTKFFSSILGIYAYIEKCEALEQKLLAEEGQKMKYHKANAQLVRTYYHNLNAGARFFYAKGQYATALPYFRTYLDAPSTALWGTNRDVQRTTTYIINAHLYQKCALLSKNYSEVGRYADVVLADTSRLRLYTLQYLALARLAEADTAKYAALLEQGVKEYPSDQFFFTHLVDQYASAHRFTDIVSLSDARLAADTSDVVALEAKSLALINLERNEEAIATAQRCLAADTSKVEVNYYIGAAYCNLALSMKLPTNAASRAYREAMKKRKSYYAAARPYLERYRQQRPDEKKKWAPLLYNVYFTLNEGKRFEEISRLLAEP